MTVTELWMKSYRDIQFYKKSGGRLTVNGSEITTQPEFLQLRFSKQPKKPAISMHLRETSMFCRFDTIEKFFPYTDIFIADIKSMDIPYIKKWCGGDNRVILGNIKRTVDAGEQC